MWNVKDDEKSKITHTMEELINYFRRIETRLEAAERKLQEQDAQLSAAEEQIRQLQDELSVTSSRLAELAERQVVAAETELPEIEVELVVDDTLPEEEQEENEAEYVVSEDATEDLLTDEELQAEDELEDQLVEAIEQPVEQPIAEPQRQETTGVTLPSVDDIRKAMSIGDRFLFQRELFHGDGEKMNKTIDALNQLHSLDDALAYIEKKFQWDKESQAYELFNNILRRRY